MREPAPGTVDVHAMALYFTGERTGRSHDEFNADMLVKLVKERDVPSHRYLRCPDGRRATKAAPEPAWRWVAEWMTARVNAIPGDGQIALVPVPSSRTVDPHDEFRAKRLAAAIRDPRAMVAPLLYFRREQEPAHERSGPRTHERYLDELVVYGFAPPGVRMVLVDDVLTSGSTMKAAAALPQHDRYRALVVGLRDTAHRDVVFDPPVLTLDVPSVAEEDLPWR